MRTSKKIPVAVLGATGSVGQRFISLLDGHPWFEVVKLTGSDRSVGMRYGEACHWVLGEEMPVWAREMMILPSDPGEVDVPLVFSALPSEKAQMIEPEFAKAGAVVCTNAGAFRRTPDVPILLPEINASHTAVLEAQKRRTGWPGVIITNPNCTSTGMTITLKALDDAFGVSQVFATSLQAISGAGYPGVASLDILDNVIPYIGGEEEKLEWEPRKMAGTVVNGEIVPAQWTISAHTNRVPVSDGHTVCMSIALKNPPPSDTLVADVIRVLAEYQAPVESRELPSAPLPVIQVRMEPDRPQPRLDRMVGNGMTTVVGRVRPDPIFHVRLVVLSHNTIRGAAGGSIYNGELLFSQGQVRS